MVIGDGHLGVKSGQGYVNYRFACMHSARQKDYLLWKRELLQAAGLRTWYDEYMNTINPKTGKKGLMCRIESPVSPVLTVLHGQMYPKSEGFRPGVLDDLEDLHLAIIFMDDGSRQVNKRMGTTINGKRYNYDCEPYIAAFRISLQSCGWSGCAQFCSWLKGRFGVHASVWSQKGAPVVGIYRNSDKELFRSIVSPHIHSSMSYKIDGNFHACRERLSERASSEGHVPEGTMRQSDLAGNQPREEEPKSPPAGRKAGHQSNRMTTARS